MTWFRPGLHRSFLAYLDIYQNACFSAQHPRLMRLVTHHYKTVATRFEIDIIPVKIESSQMETFQTQKLRWCVSKWNANLSVQDNLSPVFSVFWGSQAAIFPVAGYFCTPGQGGYNMGGYNIRIDSYIKRRSADSVRCRQDSDWFRVPLNAALAYQKREMTVCMGDKQAPWDVYEFFCYLSTGV
jgi:hypothetical protein